MTSSSEQTVLQYKARQYGVGDRVRIICPMYVFNGYVGRIVSNRTAGGSRKVILEKDPNGKDVDENYLIDMNENSMEHTSGPEAMINNLYRRYMRIRIEAMLDCLDLLKVAPSVKDAQNIMAKYIRKHAPIGFCDVEEAYRLVNHSLNPNSFAVNDMMKELGKPKLIL